MLFYGYCCPHCGQNCITAATMVRPWVECRCGKLFRIPVKAALIFQSEENVDMYWIVRFMSPN